MSDPIVIKTVEELKDAPEEYREAVAKLVISHAINELYGAQVFDEPAIEYAPTPYAKWLTCRVAMEEYGHHVRFRELGMQIGLSDEVLGDAVSYLIPNIKLKIEMYEGRPVGIELPLTVEMKVMETEPAIKGASVSNVGKPAKMETGLVVNVPPFINEGDVIRIDTASGAYIERA